MFYSFLLFSAGGFEVRLRALSQALDVRMMAGNGKTRAEDGEDQAWHTHVKEK